MKIFNRLIGLVLVLIEVQFGSAAISSKHLKHITEENWRQILDGEWMLEFHAPWCPACKDLHKAWNAFADWAKDLNINVGEIDVTENPGLSGRFLITSLPTIYHIKNGVFRLYGGPRDTEDFVWFVEERKWQVVDTLSSWKHPDSIQMSIVAKFFKLSMAVRDLHTQLVEEHDIPPWASYAMFAGGTLLLGSILGIVIVYFIDWLFPNKSPAPDATPPTGDKKRSKKEKQKQQRASKATENNGAKDKKSDAEHTQTDNESQQSQSEGEEDKEKDEDTRQRKGDKKIANGTKSPSTAEKKK